MKHSKYLLLSLLCISISACRPLGDDLLSYGQNDYQAFYDAEISYAGQFKTVWTALNENYGIWDFEEKHGVDWDEVYSTYLPKFEALDDTTRKSPVTDEELQKLYSQFIDNLHDGHMTLQIKNRHTGRYITLQPGFSRIQRERSKQYITEYQYITSLDAYLTEEIEPAYRIIAHDNTGSTELAFEIIMTVSQQLFTASKRYTDAIDAAGGPDNTNDIIYEAVKEIKNTTTNILVNIILIQLNPVAADLLKSTVFADYTNLYNEYKLIAKQIGVEMLPLENEIINDGLGYIRYSLFNGNIAYLRLGAFSLTPYLEPAYQTRDTTTTLYVYQTAVQRVWHHWFDTIQTLHASGTLGGVIIDVRNNGGGYVNDYKYVLGSLLPSGGWQSHTLRVKNGTGRYDFAPLIPFTVSTMDEPHEIIDDVPIVVLANSLSVSMAENTTWGVKSQPNGCFVGTRTFGGLSALNPDPSAYSLTYSGCFGVQNETPVWGYIPSMVCLYGDDLQPVEGYGFDPDIKCQLDTALWNNARRDNQLERALDYIHKGSK